MPSSLSSVSATGAANGNSPVVLRSTRKKTRGSSTTMSRRRISCKDLGQADFQGWLYKKKTNKGLIGNKWKKYWFVLKGTYLYWYTNQAAQKAEGLIKLPEFKINQGTECKKKHAIKASHPQYKNFYFAAENADDMNTWINKMGLAAIEYALPASEAKTEEGWSESEHEEVEISPEMPSSSYASQPGEQQVPSLQSSFVSSEASSSYSSPESTSRSTASAASQSQYFNQERQSWLEIVNSSCSDGHQYLTSAVQSSVESSQQEICENVKAELKRITSGSHENLTAEAPPFVPSGEGTETAEHLTALTTPVKVPSTGDLWHPTTVQAGKSANQIEEFPEAAKQDVKKEPQNPDEMEQLYKSLEQVSLSPIGERRPSSKTDYRRSFIKRSNNPVVNARLHKFRTLNSTLKSKEADLAVINQLLESPHLTSEKFRQWKEDYSLLLQDICKSCQAKIHSEKKNYDVENQQTSCVETDV
ncbi:interactor protein for cytohesin exchange factors 1 isoform X2 [Heterodontus francisci]|uniref:interactor protein for cytohesin exchange factors 1 isoform X2 n=1 Tax=Heterodontus francisci TaxID=7792 RepID=UPI00355AF44E